MSNMRIYAACQAEKEVVLTAVRKYNRPACLFVSFGPTNRYEELAFVVAVAQSGEAPHASAFLRRAQSSKADIGGAGTPAMHPADDRRVSCELAAAIKRYSCRLEATFILAT